MPEARKPTTSSSITSWHNAKIGSVTFGAIQRSHIIGSFQTTNGTTQSENINAGGAGDIYASPTGFYANVQTKTSTVFSTLHFIGATDGLSVSSGKISNLTMGTRMSSSIQGQFTRNVVGFWCEVNGSPTGSGDEADGCGKCKSLRVSAVYIDSDDRIRVMDMCAASGVTRILNRSWNSQLSQSWEGMSYSLSPSNSQTVVQGGWMHIGWILNMTHEKTCGGGQKQKNCTGRIRYLTPLVSSYTDGRLYTGSPSRHQVMIPRMTLQNLRGLPSNRHAIYAI